MTREEVHEQKFMHDPVNMLLADVYAKRHGFKDFLDARPLELLVIIVDDVKAIRAALDESGYVIAPASSPFEASS